jgi:hypothetical protein
MNHTAIQRVLYISMVSFFITTALLLGIYSQAQRAQAAIGFPVLAGGVFLPAVPPGFDIFTPGICNGIPVLLVTIIGPDPGVFIFAPPVTVTPTEYFLMTPSHATNNALGYATQDLPPPCPPTFHMLGSSLVPGF